MQKEIILQREVTLQSEPDEEKFKAIAEELGIKPKDYLNALHKVPIRSEKVIYAAAKLLSDIVNEIVNLEYLKYKNSHRLDVYNDNK